jgi:hypothetical protein
MIVNSWVIEAEYYAECPCELVFHRGKQCDLKWLIGRKYVVFGGRP